MIITTLSLPLGHIPFIYYHKPPSTGVKYSSIMVESDAEVLVMRG
jgi:hypothetical protein